LHILLQGFCGLVKGMEVSQLLLASLDQTKANSNQDSAYKPMAHPQGQLSGIGARRGR